MPTLPKLESLKPEENTLEQGLILILKLAYGISNADAERIHRHYHLLFSRLRPAPGPAFAVHLCADAERIHQLSMSMFYQGCVTGAETVMTALNNELILRKAASAPSSESIN